MQGVVFGAGAIIEARSRHTGGLVGAIRGVKEGGEGLVEGLGHVVLVVVPSDAWDGAAALVAALRESS